MGFLQSAFERAIGMKKKIAVFTTGWGSEILSRFLSGMTDALKEDQADIFLFLCYPTFLDTPAIKQGEMNIFNLPDLHDFDGAVIFASGLDYQDKIDEIVSRANEAGIPIILQGTKREGISSVGSDNYQAMKDLCKHVREEHGVKTISFFAGTKDSHDSGLRLDAVRDYLKENNCEEDLVEVFYTNWENSIAANHVSEMCSSGEALPDVFICANDGLAMTVCVALTENGYEVPRDALITGVDYIDDSKVFDPSIASVDQCFREMGAAAVELWKEQLAGDEGGRTEMIPCKFIPGESCNCYSFRNSDQVRRRMGRDAYSKRAMTTYFERKLNVIDSTVLSCLTYLELKENLHNLLVQNHDYEGNSFHVLLEPNFGLSIYDTRIKLSTENYSRKMDVVYSSEDGKIFSGEVFDTNDLIPGYDPEGDNHLYVFLPVHEAESTYGYLIFRDCIEKVENHFLLTYYTRMALALEKFRHALTLDHINKRLLDLMGKDPLTHVNNRMAFEDKEKFLQSQINSDPEMQFGIAMFDVNNLKMINDSLGHEAGDAYLLRACHLICQVFKHSPVYRIGGDEFVAVLTGEDYENRDERMKTINDSMSTYSAEMPLPSDYVSIACGLAVYDKNTDAAVTDVAKRADDKMYKDKAEKKGTKTV